MTAPPSRSSSTAPTVSDWWADALGWQVEPGRELARCRPACRMPTRPCTGRLSDGAIPARAAGTAILHRLPTWTSTASTSTPQRRRASPNATARRRARSAARPVARGPAGNAVLPVPRRRAARRTQPRAARAPPAARPTSGPGRLPRPRRSAPASRRPGGPARLALLPGRDPRRSGVVRRRCVRSTCAVSWVCTACRSSRSAARAIVCHLSSRGRPTIRCSSTGSPSRSPSAKCTRATSSGSSSSRWAISTIPSSMYAGGEHRHPRGQVLGDARGAQQLACRSWKRRELAARSSARAAAPSSPAPARRTGRRCRLAVQRRAAVVDQPPRGPLDQGAHLDPHRGLHAWRRAGCRRTSSSSRSGSEREDLAGHEVGPGQVGRRRRRSPRPAAARTSCPAPLTRSLTTWVTMISRRSGCASIWAANRSRIGVGK